VVWRSRWNQPGGFWPSCQKLEHRTSLRHNAVRLTRVSRCVCRWRQVVNARSEGNGAVATHASMTAEDSPVRPRALSAVKGQETADGHEVGCRSHSVPEAVVAVFGAALEARRGKCEAADCQETTIPK
jgi:hypothetical protein